MNFMQDEFPIRRFLDVPANAMGVAIFDRSLAAARRGGAEERYTFALGIYGIVNGAQVPGLPDDVAEASFQQAFKIFEEGAREGHLWSTVMAGICRFYGQGCDIDIQEAARFIQIARSVEDHPLIEDMYAKIQAVLKSTRQPGPNGPGF